MADLPLFSLLKIISIVYTKTPAFTIFFPKKLRAYPNNRVVMRPSEKFEAKAAGQKCSEAWFSPRRERFWLTTQASGFPWG